MAFIENYTGFERVKHVGAMTLAAILLGGNIVLSKVAADDGMTMRVMVAYRWILLLHFLLQLLSLLNGISDQN